MIKAGINFCRKCGKLSNTYEPFYRSGADNLSVWMKWSEKQNEYILELTESSVSSVHFDLADADQYAPGQFPPNEILAVPDPPISGPRKAITMYRSCPHCQGLSVFDPYIGRLPAFVAVIIGPAGSGKSSWIGAISQALGALNAADYPYKILFQTAHDQRDAAVATIGNDVGNTTLLRIVEKASNKDVAMLYLLDYAGETFDSHIDPQSPFGRVFNCRQANIPDCTIFVEPAVYKDLASKDVCERIIELQDILTGIPTAVICSFADELIDAEALRSSNDSKYIPKLTSNTFPRTVYVEASHEYLAEKYYNPTAIVQRIYLQDYIATAICEQRPIVRQLQTVLPENSDLFYRFLVQSCIGQTNPNGKPENDYSNQFNTADPLIWLLHKLKLFPLTLRGEGIL